MAVLSAFNHGLNALSKSLRVLGAISDYTVLRLRPIRHC